MLTYKIATASVALCSALLLASFVKAAELDPQGVEKPPVAQMNRTSYVKPANEEPKLVMTFPRRPVRKPEPASVSAQMNRVHYDR